MGERGAGAREEQRRTSVGEGQKNIGSNQNMGRRHESEDAPVHEPQGGFGYSEGQTERSHSQAPVVEKGAIDNREDGEQPSDTWPARPE